MRFWRRHARIMICSAFIPVGTSLGSFRYVSERYLGRNSKNTVKSVSVLHADSTCIDIRNKLVPFWIYVIDFEHSLAYVVEKGGV